MLGQRAVGVIGFACQVLVDGLERVALISEHHACTVTTFAHDIICNRFPVAVRYAGIGRVRAPGEVVECRLSHKIIIKNAGVVTTNKVENVVLAGVALAGRQRSAKRVPVNGGFGNAVHSQLVANDVGDRAAEAVAGDEEAVRRVGNGQTVVRQERIQVVEDDFGILDERARSDVGHEVRDRHRATSDDGDQVVIVAVNGNGLQGEGVGNARGVRSITVMGDRPGETQVVKNVFRRGSAVLDGNAESAGADGKVDVIVCGITVDECICVPRELQVDRFAGRDTGVPVADGAHAWERQSHHDCQCEQHGDNSLFHDVYLVR